MDEVERIKRAIDAEDDVKVQVALFGQPGSGKSSIINGLLGEQIAEVGVHTDTTKTKRTYEWQGLCLADLPGYDTIKFPRNSYFAKFDILSYDLFLCVFEGKLHDADSAFFKELRESGKVCLFVRNKRDQIWQPNVSQEVLEGQIVADVREQVGDTSANVLFTSCRNYEGFSGLQDAIHKHLGAAKQQRWARNAKAYSSTFLEEKRHACEIVVTLSAGVAAANGLNPLPGLDLAVDVGILQGMFLKLRHAYGLKTEKLDTVAKYAPAIAPLVNQVIEFATKEGILLLLKQFLKKGTLKEISKYIPFVGQLVAASLGYAITQQAGEKYLEACHQVAKTILEMEFRGRNT